MMKHVVSGNVFFLLSHTYLYLLFSVLMEYQNYMSNNSAELAFCYFQSFRSIEYSINSCSHIYYIPVTSSVVDISLSMTPSQIVLSQPNLSLMNYVLEGYVTLSNPHDIPVSFSWDLGQHESYAMVTHMEGILLYTFDI